MNTPKCNPVYVRIQQLCEVVGVATHTIRRWREDGTLTEGIHYVRMSARTTLYNVPLIVDLIACAGDRVAHQRAVDAHLKGMLSNQKRRAVPCAA
jgi:predicted site-specific integrase-resolvase